MIPSFLKPTIKFGTDGWRGVIGRDFTFKNVQLAAHAVAATFEDPSRPAPMIPVGYDHRFLAEQFGEEAARVLSLHRFFPEILSEPVTSPLLSFITWKNRAPFGVMITASHNPPEYLGFKVKGSFGGSVSQATVDKIEERLSQIIGRIETQEPLNGSVKMPQISPLQPHLEDYFDYLKSHLDFSVLRKISSLTFDSLYGPAGKIVEFVFKRAKLKTRLNILHNRRDPLFGGLHPEPIEEYLGDLKKEVKRTRPAAGLALDGDGDRLGVVDEAGNYFTSQQVYALLLYYLAAEKKLKGRVVQAVSLGYLSERIAKDHGLPFTEVSVGFKHIAAELLKGDVLIGGEESGGYAFSRVNSHSKPGALTPERDGLFSALLLLEAVAQTGKKPSRLLKDLERKYGASEYLRHDLLLAKPIPDKTAFIEKLKSRIPDQWLGMPVREIRTFDGLKVVLEDGSWFLVRPSGTEPLLRVYAEFPKKSLAQKSLDNLGPLTEDLV